MGKYKAGDKFKILKTDYDGKGLQVGDIVEFVRYGSWEKILFLKPKGGRHDEGLCFTDSEVRFLGSAKKTSAEKRGAKFGVLGVVNNSSAVKRAIGKKIFFVGINENSCKEEVWNCAVDGDDELTGFLPSSIRLDHEPEYREIPFSEATHEQRMDYKNVLWDGHAGSFSEVLFTHANTYILTVRSKVLPLIYTTHRTEGHTNPTGLTVRIPT